MGNELTQFAHRLAVWRALQDGLPRTRHLALASGCRHQLIISPTTAVNTTHTPLRGGPRYRRTPRLWDVTVEHASLLIAARHTCRTYAARRIGMRTALPYLLMQVYTACLRCACHGAYFVAGRLSTQYILGLLPAYPTYNMPPHARCCAAPRAQHHARIARARGARAGGRHPALSLHPCARLHYTNPTPAARLWRLDARLYHFFTGAPWDAESRSRRARYQADGLRGGRARTFSPSIPCLGYRDVGGLQNMGGGTGAGWRFLSR